MPHRINHHLVHILSGNRSGILTITTRAGGIQKRSMVRLAAKPEVSLGDKPDRLHGTVM